MALILVSAITSEYALHQFSPLAGGSWLRPFLTFHV